MTLKPFWRYYGGKYRAAPRYPKPLMPTIVEPFAGAAGYSLRYPERQVILVEKNAIVADLWAYLIGVSEAVIRSIPADVTDIDDLPSWVPTPARSLVGWWFNSATVSPRKSLSIGLIRLAEMGRKFGGWTEATRERVASQVSAIRHWKVIQGDYSMSPDVTATWFIDPPYNNSAGAYYPNGPLDIDYAQLAAWCRTRPGDVIVCENEGAQWLDFRHFALLKPGVNGKGSSEVIWTSGASTE